MVLFTLVSNAQTKVWDFSNDVTNWPLSTGIGLSAKVTDQLGLFPNATNINFGAVTAGGATYGDNWASGPNRLQTNGAGSTGTVPARCLYFTVDGTCTVKVWFKHGSSSGIDRNAILSNGTTVLSITPAAFSSTAILTGTIPAAGKYYIYGDAAININKIEVTGANVTTPALSTENFLKESSVIILAKDSKINISNIKSKTQVEVYNITGNLVKTIHTDSDASFELETSGLCIVKAKSAEGEKAVIVIVK